MRCSVAVLHGQYEWCMALTLESMVILEGDDKGRGISGRRKKKQE